MNNDIDIEEDLNHQKKAWRIRSAGFILIILFVVASALGLFGTGVLSKITEGDEASGFYIETEKFLRAGAPAQMIIHLKDRSPDTLEIFFNNDFLKNIKIESITPRPVEETNSGGNTLFKFTRKTAGSYLIKIDYTAEEPFLHTVNLSSKDGRTINFTQIIYP